MSELHLTITDYLEQGDNVYRVASVLQVPVEWVLEIEKETRQVELRVYEVEGNLCLG